MIARICTEDKHHEWIREQVNHVFDCFTINHGLGAWKNHLEPSITIEIAFLGYCSQAERASILELAEHIKAHNVQEKILVEFIVSENILL
mgnify:CR=1 FL=1